ncbi:MAG: hypothetical protein AAFX65_04425 [Cyanobacteria bacterium J06638_7]
MPAPQTLMQAAFARLGVRLGSGLLDAAANAAVVFQDAPQQLRRELQLFWDEVEQEAQRLERDAGVSDLAGPGSDRSERSGADGPGSAAPSTAPVAAAELQDRIDALRAQVAGFSRRFDPLS